MNHRQNPSTTTQTCRPREKKKNKKRNENRINSWKWTRCSFVFIQFSCLYSWAHFVLFFHHSWRETRYEDPIYDRNCFTLEYYEHFRKCFCGKKNREKIKDVFFDKFCWKIQFLFLKNSMKTSTRRKQWAQYTTTFFFIHGKLYAS